MKNVMTNDKIREQIKKLYDADLESAKRESAREHEEKERPGSLVLGGYIIGAILLFSTLDNWCHSEIGQWAIFLILLFLGFVIYNEAENEK